MLKQITEMHETLQPGQVHDLYHEAYMALLTFQIWVDCRKTNCFREVHLRQPSKGSLGCRESDSSALTGTSQLMLVHPVQCHNSKII